MRTIRSVVVVVLACLLVSTGIAAHSASVTPASAASTPAARETAPPVRASAPPAPASKSSPGGADPSGATDETPGPIDALLGPDVKEEDVPAGEVHPDGRERLPKWIESGIRRYGPISVFFAFIISGVGLHLSEDLILIPAGYIAAGDPAKPVRLFWEFAFWAYLGIVIGDSGWFWMCGTFGTRFLHSRWFKRFMHPRRLLEIKHQIDKRGAVVLLAARFIPGTRTPVITMGGLMHMSWWSFLAVELSCVLVSAPLQMAVGWFAAKAVSSAGVTKLSHQIAIGVGVTIAFVLAMYFVHLWMKSRQSKRRPPRAPARWLRIYNSTARVSFAPAA